MNTLYRNYKLRTGLTSKNNTNCEGKGLSTRVLDSTYSYCSNIIHVA